MGSKPAGGNRSQVGLSAESRLPARERILDAAEALFAQGGYGGTSMRAVALAAQVDSFRTHYYFGSKEELFRQVLTRRQNEYQQALSDSLDAVLASAGDERAPALEALVEAWLRPALDLILGSSQKWIHYFKLQYRIATNAEKQFADLLADRYRPIYRRFIDAFQAALPAAKPESVQWAFYFIELAPMFVLNEDYQSADFPTWKLRITGVDAALQKMIPFYAAGFYALASRDYPLR